MTTPNNFNLSALSYPPQTIPSAMNVAQNFLQSSNGNSNCNHYDGHTFISNSPGYNTLMVPSQIESPFDPAFMDTTGPMKLCQNQSMNNQTSVFNIEPVQNASDQSIFWTNQVQFGPFDMCHGIMQSVDNNSKMTYSSSTNPIFSMNQSVDNFCFMNGTNFKLGPELMTTSNQTMNNYPFATTSNSVNNSFRSDVVSVLDNEQQNFGIINSDLLSAANERSLMSPSNINNSYNAQHPLPQMKNVSISDQSYIFDNSSAVSNITAYSNITDSIFSDNNVPMQYHQNSKQQFNQYVTYSNPGLSTRQISHNTIVCENEMQSSILEQSILDQSGCSIPSMPLNSSELVQNPIGYNDQILSSGATNFDNDEINDSMNWEMTNILPQAVTDQPAATMISTGESLHGDPNVAKESQCSYFTQPISNNSELSNHNSPASSTNYSPKLSVAALASAYGSPKSDDSICKTQKTKQANSKISVLPENSDSLTAANSPVAASCVFSNKTPMIDNSPIAASSPFSNPPSVSPHVNMPQIQHSEIGKQYESRCASVAFSPSNKVTDSPTNKGTESPISFSPSKKATDAPSTKLTDLVSNLSPSKLPTSGSDDCAENRSEFPNMAQKLKVPVDNDENECKTFEEGKSAMKVRGKVIVPNIEEEFKFLFDPSLPDYELISSNDVDDSNSDRAVKSDPPHLEAETDFLSIYKSFLEKKFDRHSGTKETLAGASPMKCDNENGSDSTENTRISFKDNSSSAAAPTTCKRKKKQIPSSPISRKKLKVNPKVEFKVKLKRLSDTNLTANPKPEYNSILDGVNYDKKKPVPRRVVSQRKAKSNIEDKIRKSLNLDDESQSSSDSDPSWTPQEDDGSSAKKKNNRIKFTRGGNSLARNCDIDSDSRFMLKNFDGRGRKSGHACDPNESYYIPKNCASSEHIEIWKLKDKKFFRFKEFAKDNRLTFHCTSQVKKITDVDLKAYEEVKVNVIEDLNGKMVVELCEDIRSAAELRTRETFMRDSSHYESKFSAYIKSLVSQALDNNYFDKILNESDSESQGNMKAVDDSTNDYISKLESIMKWKNRSVDLVVKTWPFLSLKNIRIRNLKNDEKCKSCSLDAARQTAVFYGQPYDRVTLIGIKSPADIPNNLEKTINLCIACSKKIKLYNMIWHQKYHVFVECAKYVAKKKAESKQWSSTSILDDLLADSNWLAKVRNAPQFSHNFV